MPPAEENGSKDYVSFPWTPLTAARSKPNFRFFVKKIFFEEELIKTKESAIIAVQRLCKNAYLEDPFFSSVEHYVAKKNLTVFMCDNLYIYMTYIGDHGGAVG